MSEFTDALEAHPEMSALEVARIHVNRHPEEQTRKALNVVLDFLAHKECELDKLGEELAQMGEQHPLDALAPPKTKPGRRTASKPEAV